ncbi:MAG: hypothetical protein ACI4BH_10030 [Muribaculaceae bacterium]
MASFLDFFHHLRLFFLVTHFDAAPIKQVKDLIAYLPSSPFAVNPNVKIWNYMNK